MEYIAHWQCVSFRCTAKWFSYTCIYPPSCLEDPMDRGAGGPYIVHGVAQSWTWLKWLSAFFSNSFPIWVITYRLLSKVPCATVGSSSLSVLNIVVWTCQSQPPILSLPTPNPVTINSFFKSVSLALLHKQVHLDFFLNFKYKEHHRIFVSLCPTHPIQHGNLQSLYSFLGVLICFWSFWILNPISQLGESLWCQKQGLNHFDSKVIPWLIWIYSLPSWLSLINALRDEDSAYLWFSIYFQSWFI